MIYIHIRSRLLKLRLWLNVLCLTSHHCLEAVSRVVVLLDPDPLAEVGVRWQHSVGVKPAIGQVNMIDPCIDHP